MDIKNFFLTYYKNSEENFHIQKVTSSTEAQKPHTHEYFQIYYISKGALTHHVEKEKSLLSHGDMFIIPPKATHYITPSNDAEFFSFSFMPDFLGDKTKTNHLSVNFLSSLMNSENYRILPKVTLSSSDILYAEGIMDHLLSEFENKPIGYEESTRAYCVILLNILARKYFETSHDRIFHRFENNKQYVLHCIEYIKNNFSDELTLDEMSKRSTMSKSSFCSLFAKLTGYSFNTYINICRIKKSVEYIEQGNKITAIYTLCGYNDFSTFHRNFKKIMGIPPNEYKFNISKKSKL